jgi:hypothetical protein
MSVTLTQTTPDRTESSLNAPTAQSRYTTAKAISLAAFPAQNKTDNAFVDRSIDERHPHHANIQTLVRHEGTSPAVSLSRTAATILICTLAGITFVGSMSTGLLTIGLPRMANDLHLADNLLLWLVRAVFSPILLCTIRSSDFGYIMLIRSAKLLGLPRCTREQSPPQAQHNYTDGVIDLQMGAASYLLAR